MASFARKCFSPNKYVNFFTKQNVKMLFKTPTTFVAEIKEKKSNNFWNNYSFLDVFGRRTESHRGNRWCKFPHVFSVFGALYICTSDHAECMENEESMSKTSIAESPETNRHNKRNSTGRFVKLIRKLDGHKEKSLHPMNTALAVRKRLVFDECDENEPPSKRKTRSEKVQYKVIYFICLYSLTSIKCKQAICQYYYLFQYTYTFYGCCF